VRYSDYSSDAVELAMALANAFWRPSAPAALAASGAAFVVAHQDLLSEHRVEARPLTQRDLDEFEDLAARIRRVVAEADEAAALGQLNGLLECCETAPRVSIHDGEPHLHYAADGADCLDWIAANAAMGLAQAVCIHGRHRLGVCAADSCENLFVDASKNRTRRYCSDTCASRTTVRALRTRRRLAATGRSKGPECRVPVLRLDELVERPAPGASHGN
jgi:hypothetical protein